MSSVQSVSLRWFLGWTVCLVSVCITGALGTSHAQNETAAEVVLDIQECSASTVGHLRSTLRRLPKALTHGTISKIHIRCVSEALPFGFKLVQEYPTASLILGELAPIGERRAVYRSAHLSYAEQRSLWHDRALVHVLMRHKTRESLWHLDRRFRRANGWDEDGQVAANMDAWGYSRSLGQQSALDDWVTFSEEWFVRPSRRKTMPDNRVECQSFTKGRFITQVFYPDRPDQPPAICAQFWSWSHSYGAMEVVFTSPTSAPVSSFGHLAILLRSTDGMEAEYLDPVYQYVGLISSGSDGLFLSGRLQEEIPLILQPEAFFQFERQNRLREDRQLYRYPVHLNADQLNWVKARLWEHTRRMHLTYQFVAKNCAERVLRLFDDLFDEESLQQPGLTISPMGVISVLTQAKILGANPVVQPSLTMELDQHKEFLASYELPESMKDVSLPNLNSMSSSTFRDWETFLDKVPDDQIELLPFLHRVQDYYDLSGTRPEPQSPHPVPLRSQELLAFKQALFHEEKYAQHVSQLITDWYDRRGLDLSHNQGHRTSDVVSLTDQLVELIGTKIQRIGLDMPSESVTPLTSKVMESQSSALPWGSDGVLSLRMVHDVREETHAAEFEMALYDERQGVIRSHLIPQSRDLQILSLTMAMDGQGDFKSFLVPLRLYGRGGAFGLSRLGGLFESRIGISGDVHMLDGAIGTSVQILQWQEHRGDLSVGMKLGGTMSSNEHTHLRSPAFASITVPISNDVLVRGAFDQTLFQTRQTMFERKGHISIEAGFPYGPRRSVTLIADCLHAVHPIGDASMEFKIGLRIQ